MRIVTDGDTVTGFGLSQSLAALQAAEKHLKQNGQKTKTMWFRDSHGVDSDALQSRLHELRQPDTIESYAEAYKRIADANEIRSRPRTWSNATQSSGFLSNYEEDSESTEFWP